MKTCWLFLLLGLLTTTVSAEITLVKDGQDPCPIYTPAAAQEQEMKAAQQLADYLQKISGTAFIVQPVPDPLPERGIFVGAVDPALGKDLRRDGFVLKTDKRRLYIAGGSTLGTFHGVFELLERLGCRWWSSTEEDIPQQATLAVPDLNVTGQSPFTLHNIMSVEATTGANNFGTKSRMGGVESFTGSHTMYALLTPYAKEHPEIYPLNDKGERKANNLHFCYLAPNIAEALADALAKVVESKKGNVKDFIYFAGMGDWYGGMCQCDACKKVYEEELWTDPDGRKKPGYTATLLRMINRTAEILEQKYPGIRVGTFAYMSLEAPPAKTVPRENVTIRVPRLRHCTVHAADSCEVNQSFCRNLERWCAIAPNHVYIWDYGVNYTNFIYPFPCITSMADNIRYYRKIGIRGVMIQGNYVTMGGDLVVPRNYLWSKLLWNPQQDTRAILTEFCAGYYGPAAGEMLAYIDTLENSVRVPKPIHADEFSKPGFLTPEARAQLRQLRQQALAKTEGKEPYLRRVCEATNGIEVLDLDSAGLFTARDGKLIREDLGGDTYQRALDAIKYNRNGGRDEWTSGRTYWMQFLVQQGGPLATLTRDAVSVQVAPLLYGQIRQISYRGQPLLFVETNTKLKGYPVLGGSRVGGFGITPMRLVGEPTMTRMQMESAISVDKWRFNADEKLRQTIELGENGTIQVTGTAGPNVKPKPLTISTAYPALRPDSVRVEVLTDDGAWDPVTLPPDNPQSDLVGLPADATLRITFPDLKCAIIDQYLMPPAKGGKVVYDNDAKTLTISIDTAASETSPAAERDFYSRTIQVRTVE